MTSCDPHKDIFLLGAMITDWSGLTPLAIAQMSECSIRFLSSAQRGPWVCVIPFAGEEGLASQHVLDVVLGNAPPSAILLDFSLRRGSAREARRYAQDDCHALGWDALRHPLPRTSRWALQYLDPVSRAFRGVCPFGLQNESTRQDYS